MTEPRTPEDPHVPEIQAEVRRVIDNGQLSDGDKRLLATLTDPAVLAEPPDTRRRVLEQRLYGEKAPLTTDYSVPRLRERVHHLRRSLESYYQTAGRHDPFRLTVVSGRGAYALTLFRKPFEDRVSETLEQSGLRFERDVSLGGLTLDFAFSSPAGGLTVIEAKSWTPTPENQRRAIEQAKLIKKVSGANRVLVVLDGLEQGRPDLGLSTERELPALLQDFNVARSADSPDLTPTRAPIPQAKDRPTQVFGAMPFTAPYDDVFFIAMTHAAASVDATCRRIDQEEFHGDIVEAIKQTLASSVAVIADLSESKPNVLYEVGYAHALGLPTIHICSTPLDQLPFDVRNWNTMSYEKGQTFKLREPLAKRLKSILGKA